jgi:hypothetical protein
MEKVLLHVHIPRLPHVFVAGGTFYGNPNKYINPKFGF